MLVAVEEKSFHWEWVRSSWLHVVEASPTRWKWSWYMACEKLALLRFSASVHYNHKEYIFCVELGKLNYRSNIRIQRNYYDTKSTENERH